MKKIVLIIIGIILVAVLIIGCINFTKPADNTNSDSNKSIPAEEKADYVGEQTTIIHKDFKTIIKTDWQEFEIQPQTFIYLPPNTAQDDINAEVISIIMTYLGPNNQLTLNNILEQGVENSKTIIPDFELTENSDNSQLDMPGKKIKFTGTQNNIKRNNAQVFGIKNNTLYTITYSCPVGNCNSYSIFNTIINTFETNP